MITSFQRSMIIKMLRDNINNWKLPETKRKFLNNLDTDPTGFTTPFGIKRDDNGYFYLSDELVAYCNLKNGQIIRIRKNWTEKDWECYTELYQAGEKNKEFRIDIPQHRQIVTIDGDNWEYAELQSPSQEYGKNSDDDVFTWPELTDGLYQKNNISEEYKDNIVQYYKDFVDQATVILNNAVQISNKHNVGLPKNLCRTSTRYKDKDGYFWSDFDQDQWIIDKDSAINYYLILFENTVYFAKICGVINNDRIENIITYARTQWTII